MHTLAVEIHGIRLNLQSAHAPLIDYVKEHLNAPQICAHTDPHIQVRCFWSEGKWDESVHPFYVSNSFNAIGKRILGKPDELLWLNTLRKKGLQLRFTERQPFLFEVLYVYHSSEDKMRNFKNYEYRKYFSLMPYLVYFPILWHLERERGWTVIHASAVSTPKGSVVIAGLGASGKTTTCLALLQQPDFDLISENLIFTDGEFIYPCYEPVRLNEDSLKMLEGRLSRLTSMVFPEGVKEKSHFHFKISDRAQQTRPIAVFIPQFSGHSYVRELPADLAAEKVIAMNRLALELDDFNWYASALDMHWPKPGLSMNRLKTICKFASHSRWYELGINQKDGISATLKNILNQLPA